MCPAMYIARTNCPKEKRHVDQYDTPFGIRRIAFDKDRISAQRQAGQDERSLSPPRCRLSWAAVPSGCSAAGWKSSNPSAAMPSAPAITPRRNRWICATGWGLLSSMRHSDKWEGRYARSFAEWWQTDLTDMIRRDRNPSVAYVRWAMRRNRAGQNVNLWPGR